VPTPIIELPQHEAQTAFNLRRWAERLGDRALARGVCFPSSPEICVEVHSPGNTETEMREK
jgi:hypothetical protein